MEQATKLMSGRGEPGGTAASAGTTGAAEPAASEPPAGTEPLTGDKPAAGAPMLGLAQRFLGGLGGDEPGTGDKPGAGGGGGVMGQAVGAAAAFLGGGEGGKVKGATAEGAGKADSSLVDKLLKVYEQTHGKQFEGKSEGEYDQLTGLADSVLGTPIGKELLKAWVKSRLGI